MAGLLCHLYQIFICWEYLRNTFFIKLLFFFFPTLNFHTHLGEHQRFLISIIVVWHQSMSNVNCVFSWPFEINISLRSAPTYFIKNLHSTIKNCLRMIYCGPKLRIIWMRKVCGVTSKKNAVVIKRKYESSFLPSELKASLKSCCLFKSVIEVK